MYLKELSLCNYRNYDNYTIQFHKDITIFIGSNGQGKTNLMEAIYFLSVSKSFKTNNSSQVIQFDKDYSKIKGSCLLVNQQRHLEIFLSKEQKVMKVDDVIMPQMKDYLGYLNVVLFVPDDLLLVKSSPMIRRKFIDLELSKIAPIYIYSLSKYMYLLKQRNSYLKKEKTIDPIYLDVLDEQLSKIQIDIISKRKNFISKLNNKVQEIYQRISSLHETVSLSYDCFLKNDESYEELIALYKKNRKKDILFKQTSVGVHKDDLRILFNGRLASQFASQGQIRTIVLAIKIALVEIIHDEIGEYPILLLDDVLSELDGHRKTMLVSLLDQKIQTFISSTSVDGIDDKWLEQASIIKINKKDREV